MTSSTDDNAIILVEDDESTARLLQHCLHKAGFTVERIADGRAALELVKRNRLPALVIIDYLLPYADGLKVTRKLRDDPVWEVVPIICITGNTHEDTMMQGLRLHSDGFLTKPFRPEELLTLVSRLSGRTGTEAARAAPTDQDRHD